MEDRIYVREAIKCKNVSLLLFNIYNSGTLFLSFSRFVRKQMRLHDAKKKQAFTDIRDTQIRSLREIELYISIRVRVCV